MAGCALPARFDLHPLNPTADQGTLEDALAKAKGQVRALFSLKCISAADGKAQEGVGGSGPRKSSA